MAVFSPLPDDLREIVSAWPVRVLAVSARRSVIRLRAVEGDFCLKPVRRSQGRLEFMAQVQEHVRRQGFTRLQSLVRTGFGSIAAWHRGVAWTLTPWVEGSELSYDRTEELGRAMRVLAAFHVAASDFRRPKGYALKSNIGKWPAKIAARTADLLTAADFCVRGPAAENRFAAALRAQRARIEEHASRSLRLLGSPAYAAVCRPYGDDIVPVCHGDPAAHNFIVRRDGEVELIDLNSLRADLPCVDVWKMVGRIGFHRRWDPEVLVPAVRNYCRERPMSRGELQVLVGLLWFPEKLWRLTVDAEKASPGWAENGRPLPQRLACEMQAACANLELKERLIADIEVPSSGICLRQGPRLPAEVRTKGRTDV